MLTATSSSPTTTPNMEALTVLPSLEPVPVALGALTVLLGLKSLTQHAATALGAAPS